MGEHVKVARVEDVAPGTVKCVRTRGLKIALFNDGGTFRAYDDYCTHVGGPLTEGSCEDGVVTCMWHGAQFRVADGSPLTPPAGGKLRAYGLRVQDGNVELAFE